MWHRADPLLPPRGSHTSPEGSALRVPGQHRTGGTAPIVPRLKKKKATLGQISGVTSCPEPSGQGHACGCSPRAPRQLSHLRISHHGVPSSSCHASPQKNRIYHQIEFEGCPGGEQDESCLCGCTEGEGSTPGRSPSPCLQVPSQASAIPTGGQDAGWDPHTRSSPCAKQNHEGKTTLTRGKSRADTG